jgi:hypothetical protein
MFLPKLLVLYSAAAMQLGILPSVQSIGSKVCPTKEDARQKPFEGAAAAVP